MEKIKLETKHNEVVFKTSNLEEMKGMYTAKRVLKTWNEDFIDEDTGETVSIERNEILLDKGTLLDSHNLQTIDFYFRAGDITEVEVSNQKRSGLFGDNLTYTWCVGAVINGKKKNIFLYANSVYKALEISNDFLEQSYSGRFGISAIKELDSAMLITDVSQEIEGELKFYRIEVEIEKEEQSYIREFIVKALDAENGKALIQVFLTKKFEKENDKEEFHLILQSAKVIPCEAVIDESFCLNYLEDGEAHESIS